MLRVVCCVLCLVVSHAVMAAETSERITYCEVESKGFLE